MLKNKRQKHNHYIQKKYNIIFMSVKNCKIESNTTTKQNKTNRFVHKL